MAWVGRRSAASEEEVVGSSSSRSRSESSAWESVSSSASCVAATVPFVRREPFGDAGTWAQTSCSVDPPSMPSASPFASPRLP